MLGYQVNVRFVPIYELLSSLHTYLCRKAYKKIDLSPAWPAGIEPTLTTELTNLMEQAGVNSDWKIIYFLVCLYADSSDSLVNGLGRLEQLTANELKDLLALHKISIPDHIEELRSLALGLLSGWYEQYFRHIDPLIIARLEQEARNRHQEQHSLSTLDFVDRTTNGLTFEPTEGLQQVLLVPQYHFQPLNIIYHFDSFLLCHYSARIYFQDDDFLSPQEYRTIRSLSEKSRLKILKYVNQGPRTFIEIVRHLQLSKGITHDHILKLRTSGLIHAHFEGENLTGYSLRSSGIREMQNTVLRYIEQE